MHRKEWKQIVLPVLPDTYHVHEETVIVGLQRSPGELLTWQWERRTLLAMDDAPKGDAMPPPYSARNPPFREVQVMLHPCRSNIIYAAWVWPDSNDGKRHGGASCLNPMLHPPPRVSFVDLEGRSGHRSRV